MKFFALLLVAVSFTSFADDDTWPMVRAIVNRCEQSAAQQGVSRTNQAILVNSCLFNRLYKAMRDDLDLLYSQRKEVDSLPDSSRKEHLQRLSNDDLKLAITERLYASRDYDNSTGMYSGMGTASSLAQSKMNLEIDLEHSLASYRSHKLYSLLDIRY